MQGYFQSTCRQYVVVCFTICELLLISRHRKALPSDYCFHGCKQTTVRIYQTLPVDCMIEGYSVKHCEGLSFLKICWENNHIHDTIARHSSSNVTYVVEALLLAKEPTLIAELLSINLIDSMVIMPKCLKCEFMSRINISILCLEIPLSVMADFIIVLPSSAKPPVD